MSKELRNYYKLVKLSTPDGFVLGTHSLRVIYQTLDDNVCSLCRLKESDIKEGFDGISEEEKVYLLEEAFPDNYEKLPLEEKISYLMGTSCGAEFMFEVFDSYDDYIKPKQEALCTNSCKSYSCKE